MKNRFRRVYYEFNKLAVWERVFDIAVVLTIMSATAIHIITSDDNVISFQLSVNILSALSLFLSHFVFSEKSLPGGISLCCQKYISLIVLFGSFGGQFLKINDYYDNYDTATHLITGCVVSLIAYHVFEFYSKQPAYRNRRLCNLFCFFMSVAVSLLWEIFEFVSDFLTGSCCQGYTIPESDGKFFYFHWFTAAVRPAAQGALYDTFADVIAGLITAIITVIVLSVYLKKKEKAFAVQDDIEKVTI